MEQEQIYTINEGLPTRNNNLELKPGTIAWVKYLKYRIRNNKNFLGVFIGQTGSGKSLSALSLGSLLHGGVIPKENICFKAKDFLNRLNNGLKDGTLKPGSVLVWDETSIDLNAKQWQSLTNRIINKVMQVFRREKIIVLFTVPYLSFVDSDTRKLLHAYFQTRKIDADEKICYLSACNLQTNQISGKMYRHSLKAQVNGVLGKVKRIALPLPPKEILDFYEEKSSSFKRNVIQEAFDEIEAVEAKKKDREFNPQELTPRQKQVIAMWQTGCSSVEIGEKLRINDRTIRKIISLAMKKQLIPIVNAGNEPKDLIFETAELNSINDGVISPMVIQ